MQLNRPQFDGITHRIVQVMGTANGMAMVADSVGNQFEVRLGMRPKATGLPQEGEHWILVKRMGMWSFDSMVNAPETMTITGDRTGMHPVVGQVLEALAAHGLVIDATTGSDTVDLDDTTDPSGLDVAMTEPLVPDIDTTDLDAEDAIYFTPDATVGHERSTTAGRDADDGGPRTSLQIRTEEIPPQRDLSAVPLSIVTYMQGNTIGPQRTRSDLTRLDRTRADIVAIQGADPTDRDTVYTSWEGWTFYRPAGHAATNAIAWRTEGFEQVSTFSHHYSTGGVDRYVNGVRLRHIASQVPVTVLNTQVEPLVAMNGVFSKSVDLTTQIVRFQTQMTELLTQVNSHQGRGPLFLCGNFNVDFRRDHRHRHQGLPYVELRGARMRANWEDLGLTADAPVASGTYYDQIYLSSRQSAAEPTWQKVLRGYYGPHRPVLVTYRIKPR